MRLQITSFNVGLLHVLSCSGESKSRSLGSAAVRFAQDEGPQFFNGALRDAR